MGKPDAAALLAPWPYARRTDEQVIFKVQVPIIVFSSLLRHARDLLDSTLPARRPLRRGKKKGTAVARRWIVLTFLLGAVTYFVPRVQASTPPLVAIQAGHWQTERHADEFSWLRNSTGI